MIEWQEMTTWVCLRFEAARSNPEAVNIDEFLSLEVKNIQKRIIDENISGQKGSQERIWDILEIVPIWGKGPLIHYPYIKHPVQLKQSQKIQ